LLNKERMDVVLKCRKCGTENQKGNKNCSMCGGSLIKQKWLVIAIVGFVLCLVSVVVWLVNILGQDTTGYDEQINMGQRYIIEEKYPDAISAFDKAMQIDAKRKEAYYGKAKAMANDDAMTVEKAENIVDVLETGYENTGDAKMLEYTEELADIIEENGFKDVAEAMRGEREVVSEE